MRKISPEVAKHMDNLSNEAGVISALAIDQRGSLKRMLAEAANKPADETTIVDFKEAVSKEEGEELKKKLEEAGATVTLK